MKTLLESIWSPENENLFDELPSEDPVEKSSTVLMCCSGGGGGGGEVGRTGFLYWGGCP